MALRSSRKSRGPGIAAVGYLLAGFAAALVVMSLKIGQLAGLPRGIYFLPLLLGMAGVLAGFTLSVIGVAVAWMSVGANSLKLDWLTTRLPRLQWRKPSYFFKWSIVLVACAMVLVGARFLGFLLGLPLAGGFLLAAAACVFVAIATKLCSFLVNELMRLSA